jgi:HSP20 family protein
MLLANFDPFLAEFDQLAQRAFGRPDTTGMPMDVAKRGEELVLRFDLPGVRPDQVELTVENHTLTIRAERTTAPAEGEQVIVQERFQGTLTRQLRLPEVVDTQRVAAEHQDGVLTVVLPLNEQARPRRIEVRTGGQTQLTT